jgi:hypothetical protein
MKKNNKIEKLTVDLFKGRLECTNPGKQTKYLIRQVKSIVVIVMIALLIGPLLLNFLHIGGISIDSETALQWIIKAIKIFLARSP